MAAKAVMLSLSFFLCFVLLVPVHAEITSSSCPQSSGYALLPHQMPCYFYACYQGKPFSNSVYKCPTDPEYYNLLERSNYLNPCSTCHYSPVETTPPTTPSLPPVTTTQTTITTTPFIASTDPVTTTPGQPTDGSTATNMHKEISLVISNAHVHGAVWAADNTTLRKCLQMCEELPNCFGFDYDIGTASCWMHRGLNVCAAPEAKDNCTHFRMFDQCPDSSAQTTQPGDTDPSSTTTGGATTDPAPVMITFIGHHIHGGTIIPLATGTATADICVAICRMDTQCYGVDYDDVAKSCWIHGMDTECGDLEPKETCSHFRLQAQCDDSPTDSPTTMSVTPPTTTIATTTMTDSNQDGGTPDLDIMPSGFFEFVEGYHVPGGFLMFSGISLRQCLDACLTSPYCLALDYDVIAKSCYFHFQDSFCSQAYELQRNYHFKRLPCVEGVPNDAAATWYHFHVQAGVEYCVECTLGYCMQACYADPDCAGLDFDIRNLGCYHFKPSDVCGPLIPKDYCIHMSRDVCVPDNLMGVPIDTLAMLVYPPPSALPSGWQAYPGVHVRNGVQAGPAGMTGDDCIMYCDQDPDCMSGDYNSADGTCWLHVGHSRQCAQVEVSDTVFHFKKEGCDAVFGTLQPFLSPVWTS